jgi:hypothetical protein
MPSSIYLTAAQLQTLSQSSEDMIVIEQPGTIGAGDIEAWVCLPDELSTHRSLVIETSGEIIGDVVLEDERG